jgi:hypothetical protein
MRRRIFLGLAVFILVFLSSVFVFYNDVKENYNRIDINVDVDAADIVSDSELVDYELVNTVFIPSSPEELEMAEEIGHHEWDGSVVNYYKKSSDFEYGKD